jgi:hypothetical protein
MNGEFGWEKMIPAANRTGASGRPGLKLRGVDQGFDEDI